MTDHHQENVIFERIFAKSREKFFVFLDFRWFSKVFWARGPSQLVDLASSPKTVSLGPLEVLAIKSSDLVQSV